MAAITTPTLIQAHEVINGGLLKASPLNVRFDATLIAPHIADAERIHIAPVLCQDFYDALGTKKNNAISNYNTAVGPIAKAFPSGDDTAYETLWVKHLLQLCAWAVYYEALPFIGIQAGSGGVYALNAESAQNQGVKGIQFLQDTTLRRIASSARATLEYLCANAANFPDFCKAAKCPGCNDTPEPDDVPGRFGIFYTVD